MVGDTGASSLEKTFQFSMEDNIVNAIENIRCKRKRPSSEEIFFEIKKHDISVSIELFKDSLRNLEEKHIIVNKGNNNLESFFRNKVNTNEEEEETILGHSNNVSLKRKIDLTTEDDTDNANNIISVNDKFLAEQFTEENTGNRVSGQIDLRERYMMKLEDEIKFLREELTNRNKIIEILVTDSVKRDNQNIPSQNHQINSTVKSLQCDISEKCSKFHENYNQEKQNEFIIPKRSSKVRNNLNSPITLNNRYESLKDDKKYEDDFVDDWQREKRWDELARKLSFI